MAKISIEGSRAEFTCMQCGKEFKDIVTREGSYHIITCPYCSVTLKMKIPENSIPDIKPCLSACCTQALI